MNPFKVGRRIVCQSSGLIDFFSQVEISHGKTRIRSAVLRHAAINGVPRKVLSIIIDERLLDDFDDQQIVVEVGRKIGKYDMGERDKISLRPALDGLITSGACEYVDGTIAITDDLIIVGSVVLISLPPRLRVAPLRDDDDFRAIPRWHWSRYYCFLQYDEVSDILSGWELLGAETITEANRRASRAIYRRARELGWRKMTLRELSKNGFSPESGSWHLQSVIAERNNSPTGCGEYTLRSSGFSN